jgi:hypothetical protein
MVDDLEVFRRQAVIVKNGKIFVEDEPLFCDDDDERHGDSNNNSNNTSIGSNNLADVNSNSDGVDKVESTTKISDFACDVDSNKCVDDDYGEDDSDEKDNSLDDDDDVDDEESEKENRVCYSVKVERREELESPEYQHCYQGYGAGNYGYVDYLDDADAMLLSGAEGAGVLDQRYVCEDVDGLRFQGLPDHGPLPIEYYASLHPYFQDHVQ